MLDFGYKLVTFFTAERDIKTLIINYVQDALNAQQLNELFDDVDDDMLMQASGNDGNHQQPSTNDAGDVTTKITDASDDDDDVDLTMLHRQRSARLKDDDMDDVGMALTATNDFSVIYVNF